MVLSLLESKVFLYNVVNYTKMKSGEATVVLIGFGLLVLVLISLLWIENPTISYFSIFLLILFLPIGGALLHSLRGKTATIGLPQMYEKRSGVNKKVLMNDKLEKLTESTDRALYELSAVFPFDFFPNKIIIGEKQVVLIFKPFFFSSQIYHYLIEDLLTPVVESSIFFASLRLELGPGGFQQNPPRISYLKKGEAIRARRIMMGLLICKKEGIEFEGMSRTQIVEKVEEIGKIRSS